MRDFKKIAEDVRNSAQSHDQGAVFLTEHDCHEIATALEEAAELETAHTISEGAIHSIRAIVKAATGGNCNFVDDDVKLIVKQRDDAQDKVKVLEDENGRLRESLLPDMFWDSDGNESCHDCPEEIAELAWDNAHPNDRKYGVIEVQEAARLEDQHCLWKKIDRPDCSLKDFEMTKITGDQASGIWAAQIIEDFARAIARQALQEGEQWALFHS